MVTASFSSFVVLFMLTGNVWVGGVGAIAVRVVNVPLYFLHEKFWEQERDLYGVGTQ